MVDKRQQEDESDIILTGEDNPTESDLETEEATEKNKLQALKQKLKTCEQEKAEHLEQLQSERAEFLNSKRRLEEDLVRTKERVVDDHIKKLLPICDSFYMAMTDRDVWESVDANWRKGMEGVNNQLQAILKDYDVVALNPVGDAFDHHQHEAVGTEESEAENDTVIKVLQLGYERNGTLIRPATVILSN